MKPKIIHETAEYVVLAKPAGLVMHSDGRTREPSLADWVLATYPETASVGEAMRVVVSGEEKEIARPGIVHRLDRDTSGVVVVARTQNMFEHLKQQFKDRLVHKEYMALVYGHPSQDKYVIDAPIGKSRKDFRRFTTGRGIRGAGRDAETHISVVHRFATSDDDRDKYALVRAVPKTGRTHQIRVHAKHMHHPVVCDPHYAGKKFLDTWKQNTCPLGFSRQALHAHKISFVLRLGERVEYCAPLPHDFVYVLAGVGVDPRHL